MTIDDVIARLLLLGYEYNPGDTADGYQKNDNMIYTFSKEYRKGMPYLNSLQLNDHPQLQPDEFWEKYKDEL